MTPRLVHRLVAALVLALAACKPGDGTMWIAVDGPGQPIVTVQHTVETAAGNSATETVMLTGPVLIPVTGRRVSVVVSPTGEAKVRARIYAGRGDRLDTALVLTEAHIYGAEPVTMTANAP